MKNVLGDLRAFARGSMTESALAESTGLVPEIDFENDVEFMQECTAACMPTILQMMIMDESFDTLDEATKDAFIKVNDYMIGQGLISEAASVSVTNPKINVVRLNKQAQINRLTSIITLKMARKAGMKQYTKYKIAVKMKRANMEEMRKRFGDKAERLAKKVYEQTKRNAKAQSVVASKKKK